MMWINEEKRQRFDGILIVVDHHAERDRERMIKCISDAHAGGMAVIYTFTSIEDARPPAEDIEWIEEMDFLRPLKGMTLKDFAKQVIGELKPRYDDLKVWNGKLTSEGSTN